MLLCVDIGNSYSKFAIFDCDKLILDSNKGIADYNGDVLQYKHIIFQNNCNIKSCIISSTRTKEDTEFIANNIASYCKVLWLDSSTALPFKNNYQSLSLGQDRMALVAGALSLYGGNTLIIDAGTCITIDYLDEQKIYQGGSISLGFKTKFKALNTFTANLPLVNTLKDVELCAKTTEKAIASGVINGTINEIEQTINIYKSNYDNIKVVLCGGDAKFIAKHISHRTIVNEELVFWGLKNIYEYNYANNDK